MNVTTVLQLVDCARPVKTPEDLTSAYAPRVSIFLTPARNSKNAKISMSARRNNVTETLSVIIPLGIFHVTADRDTQAMVTRAAMKLMNANSKLIRYFYMYCIINCLHIFCNCWLTIRGGGILEKCLYRNTRNPYRFRSHFWQKSNPFVCIR